MKLRKGKPKTILEGALDSALLAVEVYNKPRTQFRTQAFITMMIIAWTRLLHAHFHRTIGDIYYEKHANGRFKTSDGDRWAWDLLTSVKEFNKREVDLRISDSTKANLEFFVKLRNKVEHRQLEKSDLESLVFGECQALLFNFEDLMISLFGEEYALHENLVFSLQFSRMRTQGQAAANRMALSRDLNEVRNFVSKYRTNLNESVFQSQEYSIKLLQIPRISNTNREDVAVEFVRWDALSTEDRENYDKITALIKDKRTEVEGVNVDRLKPSKVCDEVNKLIHEKISASYYHRLLWQIFDIRPRNEDEDPFATNIEFCHYDDTHEDYVYQRKWVDFIANLFLQHSWTLEKIKAEHARKTPLNPSDYCG
ncbi:DUF3644 domain-containing protein [Verrucomicrobiaceae bacterium 227]